MIKSKLTILSILSLLLAFIVGCSDVVKEEGEINDLVKSDSLAVSKEFRIALGKGLKGHFKKESIFESDFGDTIYKSKIGDFSETEFIIKKEIVTAKKSNDSKLIKSRISGESLNEFTTGFEFNHMVLEGFSIDNGEDTLKLNIDPIDNFIVAKMNGDETIESYEKAKSIVLNDLSLDSTFVMNQTFDDPNISEDNAGKRIAIAGLIMRGTIWDFSPSDWDIIPYENTINKKVSFKYWITEVDSVLIASLEEDIVFMHENRTDLDTATNVAHYEKVAKIHFDDNYKIICDNAMNSINSLEDNGYRNLARFKISQGTYDSCVEYLSEYYFPQVPKFDG